MQVIFVLSLVLVHTASFSTRALQPQLRRRHPALRASGALPMEPTPDLGPAEVAHLICAGLQDNDDPAPDTGITRLYNWMTPPGRVSVAPPPPRSGLQGKVSLDYFLEEAASPALGALMGCTRFSLVGELTIMPGSQTRGRIATQLVEVINDQVVPPATAEEAAMVAMLAAPDSYLESVLAATRDGQPLPAPPPPASAPPVSQIPRKAVFNFRLEEERRPPHQDCWLLSEMYHMEKTLWQTLNEGGEEFEGEDTG